MKDFWKGKYAKEAATLLVDTNAESVMLIVIDGNQGSGYSTVTADSHPKPRLDRLKRQVVALSQLGQRLIAEVDRLEGRLD